ncbi:hypothetical protein ACFCX0_18415 [Streptomyces sp. NPDC056352]|uniref:hypothetical protein n=1 Tax=Streptomyces sp. NPDC056352 TaxID=3345791 RepID=UPI0035DF2D88
MKALDFGLADASAGPGVVAADAAGDGVDHAWYSAVSDAPSAEQAAQSRPGIL